MPVPAAAVSVPGQHPGNAGTLIAGAAGLAYPFPPSPARLFHSAAAENLISDSGLAPSLKSPWRSRRQHGSPCSPSASPTGGHGIQHALPALPAPAACFLVSPKAQLPGPRLAEAEFRRFSGERGGGRLAFALCCGTHRPRPAVKRERGHPGGCVGVDDSRRSTMGLPGTAVAFLIGAGGVGA